MPNSRRSVWAEIKDVNEGGKTAIFVNYNLAAVEGLCNKAILLERGQMKMYGNTNDVVARYLGALSVRRENNLENPTISRKGDCQARFTRVDTLDENGNSVDTITEWSPFKVSIVLKVNSPIDAGMISIPFIDKMARKLFTSMHYDTLEIEDLSPGVCKFEAFLGPNPLLAGTVSMKLFYLGQTPTNMM